MRLSHLGNAFKSPRNHVWVTLNAELIAITRPLVTYRVLPVNGLISEVIPHGPEHACVWIYIPVFYQRLSKLTEEMPQNCIWVTSELLLSHLGIAFESPRSEKRLRQLGITFESPRNYVWMTLMAKLVAITWPLATYRVPLVKCMITKVISHGPEHACVWIYIPVFSHRLTELTDSSETLRIAFKLPRNCFWVTSELHSSHLARNCVWDNSESRSSHLGITFESPRNYVCMTLIAKLVAITWPLVIYRVPPVYCLITEVIFHGPEHACVWIYILVFYQRLSKLTEEMPSELHWSHLGTTFEPPRNYVCMTLMAKLVAFTWPLVTYRVLPVNCLISEVIPHGRAHEHACVWIYILVFYHRLSKHTEKMTSELHLSHLGNAFESPRNYVWMTLFAKLVAITWPL